MFGINLNSVLPMRTDPAEQSEMCSQLLFGEHFQILDESTKFFLIKSFHDNYQGWVDRKMVTIIPENLWRELEDEDIAVSNKPITNGYIESKNENIILTGGSRLPFYNPKKESLSIAGETFIIPSEQVNMPLIKNYSGNDMLSVAFMYLNTPYLWGGRNALGIDCSGFVQIVLSICGKQFPRDSSQQVEQGSQVSFLQDARSGDLAFFENSEGRISHVGILINNNQIIHASGRVKIENIDAQGIINEHSGQYSHQLRVIKRVL